MKIVIGFSKPKNKLFPWFSWLIRLVEWTEYSHVYIRFQDSDTGLDMIYQAEGLTVNFMGVDLFLQEAEIVREFDLDITPEAFKKVKAFCIKKCGYPYSLLEVINIALFLLTDYDFFAKYIKGYTCSGLVGAIMEDYLSFKMLPNEILTPKDIYMVLSNYE